MARKTKKGTSASGPPSSAKPASLKGARKNKRATAYDHLKLGVIFYRSKSYDLAIEQFQLARKQAPHAPNVWNNLAVAYLDKGDLDKAMSALQHALKLKPDYASAHFHLGQLYDKMGDREQARVSFKRVMQLDRHGELGRRAKERIEGFHPKVVLAIH
jgi:tetratricopeptide (TPR) repeat protein